MGLVVNGTTIAVSTSPNANGTAITKIVANGTTVWEKSTVKWTNIWSGTLYLVPTTAQQNAIIQAAMSGTSSGTVAVSNEYSSISDTDITSDVLRATGTYYTDMLNPVTGSYTQQTNSSLTHSSSATTTNLPWNAYGSNGDSITVNKPTSSGGIVTQSATFYWEVVNGYLCVPYVTMTNLYKKS